MAPESCRLMFFRRKIEQRQFLIHKDNCYYVLVEPLEEANLGLKDLVILTEDVHKFEQQALLSQNCPKTIRVDKAHTTTALSSEQNFSQENDCRHVTWNGYGFTFGDIQAHIFRQLLLAHETDNPWIHGKRLLAQAQSSAMLFRDVFRHQPHWKEVIVSNGRGYYRLNPHLRPAPPPPDFQDRTPNLV